VIRAADPASGPEPSREELDEMQMNWQLFADAGWTSFSGVFSTVFPLVVLIVVLACYAATSRRHS
jgi:hypothetical protein